MTELRLLFFSLITLVLISLSTPLFAASYTLIPTDDANSSAVMPEGELALAKWQHAFFRFDVSEISETVTSATFRVKYTGYTIPKDLFVGRVDDDDWSEAAGTTPERNMFYTDAGLLLDNVTVAETGYVEFDVTDFVVEQINGDGTVSLEMMTNIWGWERLASRESDSPPELIIEYTPTPTNGNTINPTDDANNSAVLPEGNLALAKWEHAFFRFDVNNISETVTSAIFRVNYTGYALPKDMFVGRVDNDDWSEAAGTTPERNMFLNDAELLLDSTTITEHGYVEFDVTDFVVEQINGDGIATLEMMTNIWGWERLASRESETPPELVLTFEGGDNAAPVVTSTNPIEFEIEALYLIDFLSSYEGDLSDHFDFQDLVTDPDDAPEDLHISRVDNGTEIAIVEAAPTGASGVINFTYPSGSFTADFALFQDGFYELSNIGNISLIPTGENATGSISIYVSDDEGAETSTPITITLVITGPPEPANNPPAFTVGPQILSMPAANVIATIAALGQLEGNFPFQVAVNDPEGDPVHVSKVNGAEVTAAGLTDTIVFTHSAGHFTANFTISQNADYTATFSGDLTAIPAGENATASVTVHVADDLGSESVEGLVINLVIEGDPVPENNPPVFVIGPQTLSIPAANVIAVGELTGTFPFQAAVDDPDGDPVHVSKVNGAEVTAAGLTDTIVFTHSAGSFTANFTVSQNADYTATFSGDLTAIPAGENATASVTVHVADDLGSESVEGLVINLVIEGDPVPENVAPVFVSNPLTQNAAVDIVMAILASRDGVISSTFDYAGLVFDPDHAPAELFISQINGQAVDAVTGLSGTITFSHSIDMEGTEVIDDLFTADFTVMRNGSYTISNVGDMTTIPAGEAATASITMHIIDAAGAETVTPLVINLVLGNNTPT